MEHSQFVTLFKENRIAVSVNFVKASNMINSSEFLRNEKFAHLFWSWVAILSIPTSFVIMYYFVWWSGLLFLFIVPPLLLNSVTKSAKQIIIEYALKDADLFHFLYFNETLKIVYK
jgi:hypothetical protein